MPKLSSAWLIAIVIALIPLATLGCADERVGGIVDNNLSHCNNTRQLILSFLVDLNIASHFEGNLFIEVYDEGEPANQGLAEKIAAKLLAADYAAVIDLILQHEILLAVRTRAEAPVSSNIAAEYWGFEMLQVGPVGRICCCGRFLSQGWVATLDGAFRQNADGTLIVIESPSFSFRPNWVLGWNISPMVQVGFAPLGGNINIEYFANYTVYGFVRGGEEEKFNFGRFRISYLASYR